MEKCQDWTTCLILADWRAFRCCFFLNVWRARAQNQGSCTKLILSRTGRSKRCRALCPHCGKRAWHNYVALSIYILYYIILYMYIWMAVGKSDRFSWTLLLACGMVEQMTHRLTWQLQYVFFQRGSQVHTIVPSKSDLTLLETGA